MAEAVIDGFRRSYASDLIDSIIFYARRNYRDSGD